MKYFAVLAFSLFFLITSAQESLKKEFHENGKLSLSVYKIGKDIHFVSYHSNGMLFEKGTFRNGKRYGTWKRCNRAGETLVAGHYLNDQPHGEWQFKLSEGQEANAIFESGQLTEGLHVDGHGQIIAQR